MSDQITTTGSGSNATFNVYYGAENRQKRIEWVSGACTVRKLYSALQNLFDELGQMDDGVPMSAQTPTEYTIGIIDSGDKDPWFIDPVTVEYLSGGALKTASWDRATTSNVGILKLTVDTNTIVAADVGFDITGAGNSGTLLYVKDLGGGNATLWIRPDSFAAANDFDDSTTLTCNGNTASFTYDVTPPGVTWETGESLWANIYSIGSLEDESITHLYVIQGGSKLVSYADASTYDWWVDGHIDVLIKVKECDSELDEAVIQVFSRHYTKTYDHYEVDLTNGGRNPIPLSTGEDLNNTTGYRRVEITINAGDFDDGNYIYRDNGGATWANTTKKAVITAVLTTPDRLDYYLIGTQTDFVDADTIQEYDPLTAADGDGQADLVGDPTNTGPTSIAGVSITHGGLLTGGSYDIDEDGNFENYSIVIDCGGGGGNRLSAVYEWSKWLTRRGQITEDANTDGMDGEQYIGSDYKIEYTGSVTGTLDDGDVVTQEVTGATGTIVNHNTTDKIIILRNSRGTFETHATDRTISSPSGSVEVDVAPTRINPIKAAPFGTFAGGKWFCAPGVVLTDVHSLDANNYQLTDDDGNVVVAPAKVTVAVTNTRVGDRIAVFRLSGGDIEKTYYSIDGTPAIESTTLVVNEVIRTDEPGKTLGGIIRVWDVDDALIEDRYRFTSWDAATKTFNLFNIAEDTADADATQFILRNDDADFSTVKVGDIVYNTTGVEDEYAYVTAVDNTGGSANLTTTNIGSDKPITTWASKTYKIGVTVRAYEDTTDKVYIPFIDVYETVGTDDPTGSESVVVTFVANRDVRVRARHADIPANYGIIPYEGSATITDTGMSNSVIRTPDTVFTA